MEYAKLGSSELSVSRICLGCMGFGNAVTGQHSWTVDETATREIVKHALDLGVNFFDTAIAYQNGTSEEYLGRALKDYAQRDEVVVATKFLPRSQQEIEAGVSGQEHIRRQLDLSLQHLGMDYVDLYIYHMWDYQTPLYDILDGMNQLVKAGKVRYIGIANCYAYQFAKANALAEKEGFAKFVSVQNHYNLLFREEEREMAKLCDEDNIAMTPYSALASGRLSRRPGETSKRLAEDSYAKLKYDGMPPKPINVMHNANDFDYKALYPSLMRENNIAPNTIIGMIQIPKRIYKDYLTQKVNEFLFGLRTLLNSENLLVSDIAELFFVSIYNIKAEFLSEEQVRAQLK